MELNSLHLIVNLVLAMVTAYLLYKLPLLISVSSIVSFSFSPPILSVFSLETCSSTFSLAPGTVFGFGHSILDVSVEFSC
jgi:hypothetical protein